MQHTFYADVLTGLGLASNCGTAKVLCAVSPHDSVSCNEGIGSLYADAMFLQCHIAGLGLTGVEDASIARVCEIDYDGSALLVLTAALRSK